jgi:hypothetical protein
MAFMGNDSAKLQTQNGESINYLPTRNLYLPVDRSVVLGNGTVAAADSADIPARISFVFPGNDIYKNDLAELNIIAANNWKRPIYFTYPPYNIGLENYVINEGLAYRLTPIRQQGNGSIDVDHMFTTLLTKFKFGGGEIPGVYFDENGRRELMSIRGAYVMLGTALASDGRRDSALRVLNYGYQMVDPTTLPYGLVSTGNMENITSLQYAHAFYLAGDTKKATLIANAAIRDCRQQVAYYNSLGEGAGAYFERDQQTASGILQQLEGLLRDMSPGANQKK